MSWFSLKVKALKILRVLCPSRHCSGSGINLMLCALANLTPTWAHICAWSELNLVSSTTHWCSDASPWLSRTPCWEDNPSNLPVLLLCTSASQKRLRGQSITVQTLTQPGWHLHSLTDKWATDWWLLQNSCCCDKSRSGNNCTERNNVVIFFSLHKCLWG